MLKDRINKIFGFLVYVVLVIAMMETTACVSSSSMSMYRWNYQEKTVEKQPVAEHLRLYNDLYSAAINERLIGHYDVAYALLQQALSVYPKGAEALYEMSMIALHYGEETGAILQDQGEKWLKKAADLAPENTEYQRAYGMALADREDYEGAIGIYEKLVAKKETGETLSELLNLYRLAKMDDKALEVLNRLETLEGAANNIFFERYRIYIAKKDTAKAYAAIDDLCAANEGDWYFVALKANLYHEQGYNDKALALYQKVLKNEPKQVYARVSLLNFYKTLQETALYDQLFDEMVYDPDLESDVRENIMRQFYIDALQSKRDSSEVMPVIRKVMAIPQENRNLGEMTLGYLSEIHVPRSEMVFVHEQILKSEPDFDLSRLELIFANVELENRERVHQLCEEGRKYNAGQVAFYIYDALALNEMGRMDDAIKVLEVGEEKVDTASDAGVRSQMLSLLGDFCHEAGMKEKAYVAYDKAVALDDHNLLCMNNYAYFLSKDGVELDKAAAMSKKTIEAEPSNPTYLDTYAWILFMQENYTQAKIYIDETLKYSQATPDNATLFDHAGDIYYRCGEVDLAMGFWKKALKLAEDADLRKSLQQKVNRGKI